MDTNIGFVFATRIEAKNFIKGFDLEKAEKKPFEIYCNNKIYLIVSGIGKSNAAMAATYMIWKYNIKIIFNIGAAGSSTIKYKVGDVFHIEKIIEYDRPKFLMHSLRVSKPDTLNGFSTACLATQDKPVITTPDRQEISKHADLVDMEGAAVLQSCRLFNAKCYLFKIVTDTPEDREISIIKNVYSTASVMFDFFNKNVMNKM